jgi:hypothetical protein
VAYIPNTEYQLEIGDHAYVYKYMRPVALVCVVDRKREVKPGNNTATPWYLGRDILTDKVVWYWDEEIGKPLSEMEVIAWAAR